MFTQEESTRGMESDAPVSSSHPETMKYVAAAKKSEELTAKVHVLQYA